MNLPKEKGYQKLTIYQKAKDLVLLIYRLTKKFPKEEQYVLVPQIRRATISVMANIGEGYARTSTKEFIRFITIAISSATELKVHLDISFELKYLDNKSYTEVDSLLEEVLKLLYSYKQSLESRVKE